MNDLRFIRLAVALALWVDSTRYVVGFVINSPVSKERYPLSAASTSLFRYHSMSPESRSFYRYNFKLHMSSNFGGGGGEDPFKVLGMDVPTADKKVIKRAYKRMALKYHPDVATNKDSSEQEKKQASDKFAKINWAYETLMGKRQNDQTYGKSTSTTGGGYSSSTGWTPPHRRSGSYASSSSSGSYSSDQRSTDWRDYMPKYDESDYDAGGDSFGSIFSDLFTGVAAGAAGLGGPNVFRDFVEFLEQNVDGVGSMYDDDDAELRILLQTASVEDIGNEMDDTELVVQQLKSKLSGLNDEILMLTAEVKVSARYSEKIDLEEKLAESQARKKVVDGYLKKAQKRLLVLQTRYKELITGGGDDSYARGGGGRYSTSSSSSSTYSSSSSNSSTSDSSRSASGSTSEARASDENAKKREGFGSSSYGRGSSRRRRSRQTSSSSSTSTSASSSSGQQEQRETTRRTSAGSYGSSGSSRQRSSSYSSSSGSSSSPARTSTPAAPPSERVPPHRRKSSYDSYMDDDKKRLRELKVDEEFDKLKKELGY